MSMEAQEAIKLLAKTYRSEDELVIAWWDAEWFREMLKDDLGWLNDEEMEICMSAADDAVEFSNLADAIVSECVYEVEQARLARKKNAAKSGKKTSKKKGKAK